MSTINYPASSPYAASPQTSWYIGNLVFRPIPVDAGDQPFILQQRHEFRPDRLSFDLYQTPIYWWVFCERNPFLRRDPVWLFVNGLTIMVPTGAYLRNLLGT